MRDKFRAYDKITDELINPEFHILGETTIMGMFDQYVHEKNLENPRHDCSLFYLNDILIEQYTGLYDNTLWQELTEKEREKWTLYGNLPSEWEGKEICEGDKVISEKFPDYDLEIKFGNGKFCVWWPKAESYIDMNNFYHADKCFLKVVGTIHKDIK